MLSTVTAADALRQLSDYSTIIDARSESEYALDRLPGAVNWPSLNDAERALIGTEYTQVSPFAARKRGAMLVARNVARHIEREVLDKPKDWRPLVYCWRGGQRSGALGLVLGQIGFRVHVLEGGYREYRRAVLADLERLPGLFDYRVVCGSTGSGKSRLLHALRAHGAQVLDLESLAEHRGSVLGLAPGTTQPGQKQFESRVWEALRAFDPNQPVFIESESKKVGDLRVPPALVERMHGAPCMRLELPLEQRVELLLADYAFFVHDPQTLCERLDALRMLRGKATVEAWQQAARAGRMHELVRALLVEHYDPGYAQSMLRNFPKLAAPCAELAWDGSEAALQQAAMRAIAAATTMHAAPVTGE
ncbi:MAG TPA: tRNA 2-selenouridine(34) synthase MnmH [Burkholderiaceae bacterium]|nr:tRNA 2-selenouridine(34) synthase MnmH [Burkholderiaceae bacterium]